MIRLNRAEVTNYMSSLDKTRKTVKIKQEPRTDDDWPIIIKAESLFKPNPENDVKTRVTQNKCPTHQRTFKDLRRHQGRNNKKCGAQYIPSQCPHCLKFFARSSQLRGHMVVHTVEKSFKCTKCNAQFAHRSSLSRHSKKHADNDFPCDDCELRFLNKPSLGKHVVMYHPDRITNKGSTVRETHGTPLYQKKYSCPECQKAFPTSSRLRLHMSAHSDTRPYICSTCDKTYKSKASLYLHIQIKHEFKCGKCKLLFTSQVNLNQHICADIPSKHTILMTENTSTNTNSISSTTARPRKRSQRSYICQKCSKGLATPSSLLRHLDYHNLMRRFECSKCHITVKTLRTLESHINPITKKICANDRDQTQPSENSSLFDCPYCDQCYGTREQLYKHMLLNKANEEVFKCPKCELTFFYPNNLIKHLDMDHLESEFCCRKCDISFLEKSNFDEHVTRIHEGEVALRRNTTLLDPTTTPESNSRYQTTNGRRKQIFSH